MMNKKYTHIFFDLDNTLWNFELNSRNAMQITFQQFALESASEFNRFFACYSRHNKELWENYRNNKVVKKDLTRLRFQNTFNELNISGIDADEMNFYFLKEMPKQKELNEGVMDILNYLKTKRYHLNIITNGFKEVQLEKIETSGLKPYFDKIFVSEVIKSPKPKPEIFEYAVKSVNAKKAKSIMIGDDWDVDVMGAVNFGIDAVHFQNSNKNITGFRKINNPFNSSHGIYSIGVMSDLLVLL